MEYQYPNLFIQLPNTKDYQEIEPITSSRFKVGIIYMDGSLFYYAISLLLLLILLALYIISIFHILKKKSKNLFIFILISILLFVDNSFLIS